MSDFVRQYLVAVIMAIAAGIAPIAAHAEDDPIAFVQSLYALPNLWADVTTDQDAIARYLDKNLGALITENYAKSDYSAALDYDPLVQAQDFDQVKATLKLEKQAGDTATVDAEVDNLGELTDIKLDLSKTPDGWRLSNIRTDEESPSLVDELKQLNATDPDGDDSGLDGGGDDSDSGD
jgi:hypothetical protein